ncbi:hypothetical protein HPB51_018047 [Rhipicephalus microplus]|uniref:Uncharacterized protein n=1 Tax=Rhipicephalus microplus TaxID=6941 RepID=A0A9J6DP49_RHIMP|nr:hypothetical protein HPB51_018047 [Rhipicephalus microplus]
MTRKLVHCVAKNASSWLRPLPDPYSRPPSMSVFVGYPPSEDTEQKMDQKYSAYPAHKLSSNAFLSDWLTSAKVRSKYLVPSDNFFDPLVVDIAVTQNGSCVALPAAVVHVMFQYDVVAAFKHGAIGHMITKRFIQRYMILYYLVSMNVRPPWAIFDSVTFGRCATMLPPWFVVSVQAAALLLLCSVRCAAMSDEERATIVQLHNEIRNSVALGQLNNWPAASDMQQMVSVVDIIVD